MLRFLRAAHAADLRYTARDGINLVRYAMKVLHRREAPDARAAVRRALAPERLAPRVAPGIRLAPVVHEALESAALVRALLEHFDPAAVAVELPATLGAAALTAADRLPRLSLVVSEHQGEEPLVWLATPGEPFAEALRWAGARGRGRFLVDPDLPYTERHRDPVPDPYALFSLAPAAWFDLVARAAADRHGEEDARLGGWRISCSGPGRLGARASCSLRRRPPRRAPARLARPAPARSPAPAAPGRGPAPPPGEPPALLREPPLAQAVWELRRDGGAPPETAFERTVAPRVVLARGGLRLLAGAESATAAERAAEVARFAARHAVRSLVRGQAAPDRWALGRIAWRIAAASHHEATEERLTPWQRRLFLDFARRCARLGGRLVPGLYEWIVAGRGVADDNFAWELFDALTCYPWQAAEAELPTVRVEGDELDLGTRRLRFRLRFRRTKQRPVALPVRRRPRPEGPEDAADWLRPFLGGGLCSYPPEDLVVEEYGRHLAARARSLLADERSRSEPFTTSLLDGVDLRETLRRWAEDGRVWVHERGRAPGAAGAVVVIFDRDRANERFPFAMTWHGEHHQESDMAFYATDPAAQVVGPGILRATYGGFLLTHPPGRLWDPWRDPDYAFAREKAEPPPRRRHRLLARTADRHVAREAPPSRLTRYAARQKRVVYLPGLPLLGDGAQGAGRPPPRRPRHPADRPRVRLVSRGPSGWPPSPGSRSPQSETHATATAAARRGGRVPRRTGSGAAAGSSREIRDGYPRHRSHHPRLDRHARLGIQILILAFRSSVGWGSARSSSCRSGSSTSSGSGATAGRRSSAGSPRSPRWRSAARSASSPPGRLLTAAAPQPATRRAPAAPRRGRSTSATGSLLAGRAASRFAALAQQLLGRREPPGGRSRGRGAPG